MFYYEPIYSTPKLRWAHYTDFFKLIFT
jgi:hypothetical protein